MVYPRDYSQINLVPCKKISGIPVKNQRLLHILPQGTQHWRKHLSTEKSLPFPSVQLNTIPQDWTTTARAKVKGQTNGERLLTLQSKGFWGNKEKAGPGGSWRTTKVNFLGGEKEKKVKDAIFLPPPKIKVGRIWVSFSLRLRVEDRK